MAPKSNEQSFHRSIITNSCMYNSWALCVYTRDYRHDSVELKLNIIDLLKSTNALPKCRLQSDKVHIAPPSPLFTRVGECSLSLEHFLKQLILCIVASLQHHGALDQRFSFCFVSFDWTNQAYDCIITWILSFTPFETTDDKRQQWR